MAGLLAYFARSPAIRTVNQNQGKGAALRLRSGGLDELSEALGFAPQHLFSLAAAPESHYTEAKIPKRRGGFRRIQIPSAQLKGVQRTILRKLLIDEPVSEFAFAYVPQRSVVSAARKLCGSKAVLRLDIKDFFPSISRRRVYGLFRGLGFSKKCSYTLTQLCCFKNALGQGAPTSPHISNLMCRMLDRQMSALVSHWGLNYLRYSDDMFVYGPANFNSGKIAGLAAKVLRENGFKINKEKTRYFAKRAPKSLLGLSLSGDAPAITGKSRRIHRAMFHRAATDSAWARENYMKLQGVLQWHKCVHGKDDRYAQYESIIGSIEDLMFHDVYET